MVLVADYGTVLDPVFEEGVVHGAQVAHAFLLVVHRASKRDFDAAGLSMRGVYLESASEEV